MGERRMVEKRSLREWDEGDWRNGGGGWIGDRKGVKEKLEGSVDE